MIENGSAVTGLPDGRYKVWGVKHDSGSNHYLLTDEAKNIFYFYDADKAFRLIFLPLHSVFEKRTEAQQVTITIIRQEF